MKINEVFENNKGEKIKIVEVDDVRKTCMIENEDGKIRSLSFSTLKDKRRWNQVVDGKVTKREARKEMPTAWLHKEDINKMSDEEWEQSAKSKMVPMPVNEKAAEEHIKQIQEDFCGDGTSYAEIGKEIAEQAKQKAKKASKKNLIKYNGKELTLHGWAKELSIPFGTLYARVNRFHWTYEEAFTGVRNKK